MKKQAPYETIISSPGIDPEWDDFVLETPTAHHEQTSLWGEAQRHAGWSAVRLLVRQGGKLVGGAQILEKPVGPFGWTVGYLNRGPLAASNDHELGHTIIEGIKHHAKRRRMIYLAVVLPYDGQYLENILTAAGFALSPPSLPPTTSMRSTIVLDLAPDTEQILMQMRSKTRQNIRKALKRDLHVRMGDADELKTFIQLLKTLCVRRGVRSNVPMNDFVPDLWTKFATKGMLHLFLTENNDEPVAALLVFTCGRWARAWRYGWTGNHANSYPNELIYWEAIKWAKDQGYRFFDFLGFDTKYAYALVHSRPLPEAEICKISFFKQGFGGQVMPLHSNYCYFCNPLIRTIFNTIGTRIAANGIFGRLGKLVSSRE
jgi:lipid II:glycine glycyltransferase (peptidoglycan interpeptide bridge formation enzyme)